MIAQPPSGYSRGNVVARAQPAFEAIRLFAQDAMQRFLLPLVQLALQAVEKCPRL
jgi:hypothetical protein